MLQRNDFNNKDFTYLFNAENLHEYSTLSDYFLINHLALNIEVYDIRNTFFIACINKIEYLVQVYANKAEIKVITK